MGRENQVGNSPESRPAPIEVYNKSMSRLKAGKEEYLFHPTEVIPLVVEATTAAVEMQQGDTSNKALLDTHRRLSQAYAAGAKTLHDFEWNDAVVASFMNGYIQHTQEVVKLQGKESKVVIPEREQAETTGYHSEESL